MPQFLPEGIGIAGTVDDQAVERAEQQPDRPPGDVHGEVVRRTPAATEYANRHDTYGDDLF